jgi:hypothetical protein
MKFILIALIAFISVLATPAKAQSVPSLIVHSFANAFPLAGQATWSSLSNLYRAEFLLDKERRSAFFNQTGELVVVTRYIPFHRLPKGLRNDLIKQFPNHTSVETLEVINDESVDYYATVIEKNKTTILSSKYFGRWQEFRKSE